MSEILPTDDPDMCLSDPPLELIGPDGQVWESGDCWCTLAPGHEGDCICGPCTERHGAPGWPHREGCCDE